MYCIYCVYFFFLIYLQVKCEDKVVESKNPLPYFRRLVEEIPEDTTLQSSTSGDPRSNLVSFLIKNVKQIYNELDDSENPERTSLITTTGVTSVVITGTTINAAINTDTVTSPTITTTIESTVELSSEINDFPVKNTITPSKIKDKLHTRSKVPSVNKFNSPSPTSYLDEMLYSDTSTPFLDVMAQYANVTPVDLSETEFNDTKSTSVSNELTEKKELMHLSKNLIFFETDRRERDNNIHYYAHNASYYPSGSDISLRSCIFCDNVFLENCNDPRNRLIPSTVCERDDDVCYSQHTPFGVIDRGCYNVNHNLTTYVCSCNLCNYISISEMPYVFSTKRDWVDNVVELSRTRHLRKSVFKDMSCLKCESNASSKTGDMLDTANCLEGNIGSLATEECEENEVCAVKAIKHDGYLWRGCVKEPLYNYWWTYCDSDLCNYDIVTSIYDID